MTDERFDVLDWNLQRCARAYGLGHWILRVPREWLEVDDDETVAKTECAKERDVADVRFAELIFDKSPPERIEVMAHELGHVHDARVDDAVQDLQAIVPATAWRYFDRVYERVVERRIESTEKLIATLLPEWTDFPWVDADAVATRAS